jgi:hypothetical protein
LRVILRYVGPQLTSHGRAGRAAAEAQMSDQALCAPREAVDDQVNVSGTPLEGEPVEQFDTGVQGSIHGFPPDGVC